MLGVTCSETDGTSPHCIVCVDGICGGRAIIEGSRVSVRHVTQLCKAGATVDEVLQAHPHLRAAEVYDAIEAIEEF